jgi:hypothetical protein
VTEERVEPSFERSLDALPGVADECAAGEKQNS